MLGGCPLFRELDKERSGYRNYEQSAGPLLRGAARRLPGALPRKSWIVK